MSAIEMMYVPRSPFLRFHARRERWTVLVAHRRAGKTVATVNDLLAGAISTTKQSALYAYIAPYRKQAKDIAWRYLKEFAAPVMADKSESELFVELVNGNRVRLFGADNAEAMRGLYFDGAVLDEFGDFRPGVFAEVIRPALSDRKGWAVFAGTPKGRNDFYHRYQLAQATEGWLAITLRASETGLIPKDELEDALRSMTPDQYRQEYECSFEAAVAGAYFAADIDRAVAEGRVTRVPIERGIPVNTAWDLGISDSTAIWFYQNCGREVRIVDYYESSGDALDDYARVLFEKGYLYGDHTGPHDLQVRELGTGKSRIEVAQKLGIDFRIAPQIGLQDGIHAVRLFLDRCWFDAERCAAGIEALRHYRRDTDRKTKEFKARPLHDWSSHAADAFRYLVVGHRDPTVKKIVHVTADYLPADSFSGY